MARACRCAAMAKHVAAAALLALLSVSVAVSAVSLLPLRGWHTMDVELVCRTAESRKPTVYSNPIVSDFRFTTLWRIVDPLDFTVFPLYVDKFLDDDFVRTYYPNVTDKYTISDSGGCVHSSWFFEDADEVLVTRLIGNVLGTPLPLTYNSTVNRGIDARGFSSSFDIFIPVGLGGLGRFATYSVDVMTTVPGWTVNLVPVEQTVLSVELTSAVMNGYVNNCLFTIFLLSSQVFDARTLVPPSSCKRASSSSIRSLVAKPVSAARSSLQTVAGVAGASVLSLNASANSSVSASPSLSLSSVLPKDINPAMPDFPDEFTANFFVIMPSNKSILEVREAFSPDGGISRATLLLPTSGSRRHTYLYDWFVDWYNQMVYVSTKYASRNGKETSSSGMDEYFSVQESCQRIRMGYNMMAGSIRSLLMYSPSVPPTFIGNQTVRNVPCGVWTVQANGFRVTWFWATSGYVDTTPFHTPESVRSGASAYSKLMRMTVEMRKGAPPMFPHHPFFQQPYAFPLADRSMACGVLGPGEGNVGCNDNHTGHNFLYIYDIATFVPYVRLEDYTIPKACNGTKISDSIPSAVCHLTRITSGVEAMLLVVIALLFALVSGCCVWCHFSRMVRHQQDELARLTWEIHLAQSTNGTDGQDTAILSATGCGADVKNSSS
ncbi:hypothetical protein JIQ42_01181 [Leishmania sp. Namibia]|uniref:hypothetical protein n=2 Tax=Leishmania sp. Namibia TaxID=2802991 RepID=UPI001B6D19C3|nr:hypothetical protein JIQ42_01181 [Leishmania sp. Namibia]